MIKGILICLLLSMLPIVTAQNLRVIVINDLSEPMSFAYLYLNGKPILATDSLGQAILPNGKIQPGDTLSAVVIGTDPVNVIYDSLIGRSDYTFVVNEIYKSFQLNEVVVTTDIRKIYLKHTKLLPSIIYNCELFADFEIEDKKGDYHAKGSLTAENIPYSKHV